MHNPPLFSIATPCFNSGKTIERTIKSILVQDCKDYEYIIVDGGSTDNTIDIVKQYEPLFEGRMSWRSEPDNGLYDAFNKGIQRSSGRYCWNVNSDDYIEPDALSKLKEIVDNLADDTVIVGSMYIVDELGERRKLATSTDENTQRAYKSDYMINHAATVVPRVIYNKYGLFDIRFKICADLDWFHRCYKNGVCFLSTDVVLTNFSLGGISTSFIYNKEKKDKWLYYKKNYSAFVALFRFVKWHKSFIGEMRRSNRVRKIHIPLLGGAINTLKNIWYKKNSNSYISYLRKNGVKIGDNCIFRSPHTTRIDIQRPELVTIGNNVDMNMNFQILTHDWSSLVFRAKYHDFINSTGKVIIGNNIYFGTDVIVLKGVSIGDNCIIGAGSIITKNIPANSVAAGVPCKVVCNIDDYYKKRKSVALEEAVERVHCYEERYGKRPLPKELREEFVYYINSTNVDYYESIGVPVKSQLQEAYDDWMRCHKESLFPDFESFIKYCENH